MDHDVRFSPYYDLSHLNSHRSGRPSKDDRWHHSLPADAKGVEDRHNHPRVATVMAATFTSASGVKHFHASPAQPGFHFSPCIHDDLIGLV